ncbi:MAG TPA: hypothetical protein VK756_09940 [Solirubrobacteraceae bacterium]|nr:hypothetical protein [Solirubrobacteraceae bacterium]
MSLHVPIKRTFAALLLPASLLPVLLLSPSLVRAPATLWRHTAHALAPAHPRVVHREAPGPAYYLIGPARLEIDVLEAGVAGKLTPKVGYSPLAEPEWAARAAAGLDTPARTPIVLIARGRELTTASGRPLILAARPARTTARRPAHKR